MLEAGKHPASLTRYVKKLRGGSQAILALASDDCFYVVKFFDNPQGRNVLFNECLGTELYRHFELEVPDYPSGNYEGFHRTVPLLLLQSQSESVPPRPGLCFGSKFLGWAGCRFFEILDGNSIERVHHREDFWLAWLLDICSVHCDHRQAIFERLRNGQFKAVFIDHSHMFGGSNGDRRLQIMAPCYLDRRIYPQLTVKYIDRLRGIALGPLGERLRLAARLVPSDGRRIGKRRFDYCLEALSTRSTIEGALEMMLGSHISGAVTGTSRYETAEQKLPLAWPGESDITRSLVSML